MQQKKGDLSSSPTIQSQATSRAKHMTILLALSESTANILLILANLIWKCDLSIPEERIGLYNWISEEHDDLNVLVNNAGIQQRLSVSDDHFFSRAKYEITINVEATVHLISLFLKLRKLKLPLASPMP